MRIIAAFVIILALTCGAFAGGPPAAYVKNCQTCHGADGNPSAMGQKMGAPAFSSADVQKMSDAQLTKAILTAEGHKKFPHNFSTKGMTPEQAKEIVAFIRTLKK